MRCLLRCTVLAASVLVACWAISDCSTGMENDTGKMTGPMDRMDTGKMTGPMSKMDTGKMGGPMDRMDTGKVSGPMDKMDTGKMETKKQ